MAIKKILLPVVFSLFANLCLSQDMEEQRKYIIDNEDSLLNFIRSSGELNGLSVFSHSEDKYYDIYLDTPDFSLCKNHLSLRFRKRRIGNQLTYGFQLKSEMADSGGLRMEIEETELDFFRVKKENEWIPLTNLLDVFFLQLEKNNVDARSEEIQAATRDLQNWIRNNSEGPIAPFQKLLHLGLKGLGHEELKTLRPVMYGNEKRLRGHIYIAPSTTNEFLKSLPGNKPDISQLPDFFKLHPDCNWVLEMSLDSAVFYPLLPCNVNKAVIYEFEVENKYSVRASGTEVMNIFEKGLKERFAAISGLDSKYLQSLKIFRMQ